MFKNVFPQKNARQAPAGTAESKKKDSKKGKIFNHQWKAKNVIQFPNVDFLTTKGKQLFAFYFPNVDFLMIKSKHVCCYFSSFGYNFRFLGVRFYVVGHTF